MNIPKLGNILIPSIQEKIERKLKELNLKPEITPKKFFEIHQNNKHRYFSPCLTSKGKTIGFYARVHFNLDARNKVRNEIEFLEKTNKNKSKINQFIPKIINFGIEKDFEWFTREYLKGLPLGQNRSLSQKINQKTLAKLIKIVIEIAKIPPKKLKVKLPKFNCQRYLNIPAYEKLIERRLVGKEAVDNILKMIKNTMPLLKKENHYLSHNDLNLGNILLNHGKILIIDWELIHINNFAYDISYLWTHLWQLKSDLRKKMIEIYLKNISQAQAEKFKRLLPVITAYVSLGGILTERKGKNIKKRKKFYKKILENCAKNFNKLIEI